MAELTKAIQANVGNLSIQLQYSEGITNSTIREIIEAFILSAPDNNIDINVYQLHQFRPFEPEVPVVEASDLVNI